jgi:hypothetical protein
MASYRAVNGALLALEDFFKNRIPSDLTDEPVNARVNLLGSAAVAATISGNTLGIYLHRITIDPHGRSRYFPPLGNDVGGPQPELPVNLHFLLIASGTSASIEADLMTWAMIELANAAQLDISHLSGTDPEWTEAEILTVTPEDMSTEDLMRIWDVFESPYTNTVPYIARTIRLRLDVPRSIGPDVISRELVAGRV